jgi:hypothetical protein
MRKHVALLMIVSVSLGLLLGGCGKGKDLFGVWTSNDGVILDLSGFEFGAGNEIAFSLVAGGYCTCDMAMSGSESEGNYVLSSCEFDDDDTGAADPDCAALLDGAGTFTNDGETLKLCDAGGSCSKWH